MRSKAEVKWGKKGTKNNRKVIKNDASNFNDVDNSLNNPTLIDENHLMRNVYNITLPISTFDDALEIENNAEINIIFLGFNNGVKFKEEK